MLAGILVGLGQVSGRPRARIHKEVGERQRVTKWMRKRQKDRERQAKKKEAVKREGERQKNRPRAIHTERRKEKGKGRERREEESREEERMVILKIKKKWSKKVDTKERRIGRETGSDKNKR